MRIPPNSTVSGIIFFSSYSFPYILARYNTSSVDGKWRIFLGQAKAFVVQYQRKEVSSMQQNPPMKVIARIHSDFPTKFGIPRQSGLVPGLLATVVFLPEYRVADALRGLEGFSHLWLIWEFSGAVQQNWSPTVRPPRLGGNRRMGVFATRSPFRPNPIGLSSVRLEGIQQTQEWGTVLQVSGADLMDGTPIYDIKPYLPYADCHPDATGGYTDETRRVTLKLEFPPQWLALIPQERHEALCGILSQDPRPSYQGDPTRIYGFAYAEWEIRFRVSGETLTVCEVLPRQENKSSLKEEE